MIINSIHGDNILKYAQLKLNQLPEAGIIAISGENESGKSTIGEAICFAFFGRTFSLEPEHIKKIIRWGETHCSVTISFQQGEEHYCLSRFLDNDGNHSAKLMRLDTEAPLANGVNAVTHALHDLLGYNFDDFISSFYLAQREITTPHPRSKTIKIMAGIAPFELVATELNLEISHEEQEILTIQQKISEIELELTDLSLDKTRLRGLRKQYNSDNDILTELRRKIKGLQQRYRRYKETLPLMRTTHARHGITSFMYNFLLLVTILVGGWWILFTQFSEYLLTQLITTYLVNVLPSWSQHQNEYLQWSLFGALGACVWFLLFLMIDIILKRRMQRMESERISLAVILRKIYHTASVYRSIETSDTEGTRKKIASLSVVEYPTDEEVHRIAQLIVDNSASVTQIESIITRTLAWLGTLANYYEQTVSSLDGAIIREDEKLRKAEHLESINKKFYIKIDEHRQRIVIRQLANELLQAACRRIAQHFNRDVCDLVGTILPLFTNGRYQYLRIDNDLNVRIFSKEKHDFLDLDEVSSGTQRQIMLALRLTLARQLQERTRGMRQFLFLDEPFAFFDASRTRQSLSVLPKFSDQLNQIWIVAQSFAADVDADFSRHIICLRDNQHQTSLN